MKYALLFLFAASFTTGCATGVIKDDWTKTLIGKTGFIREPVQIVKDEKKHWSSFAEFKRCEPAEIVEARAYGKNTGLVVKQEGKLFYIFSAHNFVNDYKSNPTEAKLNEYLSPSKEDALGEKKTVKLANGTHDSHELQCSSTFWPGMTANQLVFVKGRPAGIDRTTTKTGFKEQWTYSQTDGAQRFELENDLLKSWN